MVEKHISPEHVNQVIAESEEAVWEPFPGITIVAWNLPNGFTVSDQSGCIDPSRYDREVGVNIARKHLEDKVWELEGYLRTQQAHDEEA